MAKSEEYQRYLENKMSSKERHEFEKHMLDDDFETEAFEGISQLKTTEFSSDLKRLKNMVDAKTDNSPSFAVWKLAATLLLFAACSFFVIYFLVDSNSTNQIAQNKESGFEEITDLKDKANAIIFERADETKIEVIADQEEVDKNEQKSSASAKEPQTVASKSEENPEIEGTQLAELEEEIFSDIIELDEVQPIALPVLSNDPDLDVIAEIAIESKVESTDSKKALAPVAIMKKEAFANQARKAGDAENMRTITGKVSSEEDDEVLPGVNVIVKGTGSGTVTDNEGNYAIDVPTHEEATLVFASVGFMTEEVKVGDNSEIDVNIKPDITALSEIVVIGYGTVKDVAKPAYSFTPPKPIGGHGKFKDYIKKNIQYPASGLDDKIKGTVRLKFTVEQSGEISNMEVQKSLGENFDQEAIRLVNEGPKWEPATENDSTVVKYVKIKIRFRPKE